MVDLKPCLFCGSSDVEVGMFGLEWCVECQDCGAFGPNRTSRDEAIDGWNVVPRKDETEPALPEIQAAVLGMEVNS